MEAVYYLRRIMITQAIHTFKTSPVHGGHLLKGDIIEIDSETVTLQRGYYFFKATYAISIPITNIVNIQISEHKIGAEIFIQSFSSNYIISRGYSFSDALKMKKLIQQ